MLFREIMAVCSEIHRIHINTLCGQNVELQNVKLAVHKIKPVICMVNCAVESLILFDATFMCCDEVIFSKDTFSPNNSNPYTQHIPLDQCTATSWHVIPQYLPGLLLEGLLSFRNKHPEICLWTAKPTILKRAATCSKTDIRQAAGVRRSED